MNISHLNGTVCQRPRLLGLCQGFAHVGAFLYRALALVVPHDDFCMTAPINLSHQFLSCLITY